MRVVPPLLLLLHVVAAAPPRANQDQDQTPWGQGTKDGANTEFFDQFTNLFNGWGDGAAQQQQEVVRTPDPPELSKQEQQALKSFLSQQKQTERNKEEFETIADAAPQAVKSSSSITTTTTTTTKTTTTTTTTVVTTVKNDATKAPPEQPTASNSVNESPSSANIATPSQPQFFNTPSQYQSYNQYYPTYYQPQAPSHWLQYYQPSPSYSFTPSYTQFDPSSYLPHQNFWDTSSPYTNMFDYARSSAGSRPYAFNTIRPPPLQQCASPEGNIGLCASEQLCQASGGAQSVSAACGEARLCCVHAASKCGVVSSLAVTNIQSPGYPEVTNYLRNCPVTLGLAPDVCQVRVDFLKFRVGKMSGGRCHIHDSLLLQSSQQAAMVPMQRLCGTLADPRLGDTAPPHLYIHIPNPLGDQQHLMPKKEDFMRTLSFNFNVKNSNSSWNLRVTQIKCDGSPLQAPTGCSQYYSER